MLHVLNVSSAKKSQNFSSDLKQQIIKHYSFRGFV